MIKRDAHHILSDRLSWEARPDGAYLREQLIARDMYRQIHSSLHDETSPVPVPLHYSLQWLANRFERRDNIFDGIDAFCSLLEAANRRRCAKPIEREVNLLAVEALQSQIPYLQEGLPATANVIDLGARKNAELIYRKDLNGFDHVPEDWQ